MSHVGKGYDINQTFIIEPIADEIPILSACTALYSNFISSCSGDTKIFMGSGTITFDGSLYTNDNLTGSTIYASTYYSGGTNLFDIINDVKIVSGTFNNTTDTLTLNQQNGSQIIVTGFTDYYTTGTTLIGNTVYFNRNDQLSAYTLNLSSFSSDTYVTGVTFSNNQLIITRNDGVNLNTFINTFTGLTINGLLQANTISANTISATTFYGDGSNLTGISTQDTFVTGGTYSNGTAVFTNNTGGTFNVTGFYTGATDVFVTGGTYSTSASTLTFTNNTGGTFNVTGITTSTAFTGGTVTGATNFTSGLSASTISATTYENLPLDVFVTGGTYLDGTTTFTNNTGGTFNITGFSTGYTLTSSAITSTLGYIPLSSYTDTFVTGATYNNNTFTFTNNTGSTFDVSFDVVSGLTVNGGLTATTLYGDGSNISGINFAQLATTAHTHPISDVINLQSNLDSKIDKPASPFLGDYLYYNGITWVPNQVNIPVAAGAGITLFLSITGSSLPTYEYLSQFPIELTETQEPVVVNNSQALIGKYATEQLNRTVVDPGIWEFNTYASVDIPSTGSTQIIVSAFLLTTGNTETFLFSASTENITTTAATLYTISVVEPQYSCNTTDYLVVNYSASTTNNFNTTVTLYHGGNVNYSHIHTPFITLHNDLAGLQGGLSNQYYHLSKNEADLLTTNVDASSIHNHDSLYLGLGGGTVTGQTNFTTTISANTISASTFYGDGSNLTGISTGPISVTGTTLYSNNPSTNDFSTNNSVFFGGQAGYSATSADYSIFIGNNAGYEANNAFNSNFIGLDSGYQAYNASNANFMGLGAGSAAINASYSNFIGRYAGSDATNAVYSNFIGLIAGGNATNASYSNILGFEAGRFASNASYSNLFGFQAGKSFGINNKFE